MVDQEVHHRFGHTAAEEGRKEGRKRRMRKAVGTESATERGDCERGGDESTIMVEPP